VSASAPSTVAARLWVSGVVQGVGFRPFVFRLAQRHGLAGWVRNTAGGVQVTVEGDAGAIDAFAAALGTEAPPLARVETVAREVAAPDGIATFSIRRSADDRERRQPVPPDACLCQRCEAELFDPANRRYRHPFITCTDCGPRFSVIESMPYDRERTSMRAFTQCGECRIEYVTPGDRRYHSESNSCPACGPRLWLTDGAGRTVETAADAAVRRTALLLTDGQIVAIRGLGGFHLACDATNEAAVLRLRERKHREAKPFAVMVRTLFRARALATVTAEEALLLTSVARPVVLLRRRGDPPLAAAVSPGLGTVGVILAYTPLHHLLLEAADRPLVMTSGNLSDEPICIANGDALTRLAGIADAFLLHDREIVTRYDDSVVRVAGRAPLVLRRARGYAPLPVPLPVPAPVPLLAVGPHLKNTLTLAAGSQAYVSQHIGDLEDLATLEHFQDVLARHRRLFRVDPEVVVRDLHPGYLSTRLAAEFAGVRTLTVQHHHAHVAAVAAEHGVTGTVIGVSYDGSGYGTDGHVWGAEVLVADLRGFRRAGRLREVPLPGGDLAARRPWRSALGYLSLAPEYAAHFQVALAGVDAAERALAERQLERHLNAPLASSMGRLFDAAAAVLGVRQSAQYEGQAAMELEALAGFNGGGTLPFPLGRLADGLWEMDPLPLLAALGARRARGVALHALAAAFHESVAVTTAELVARVADEASCRIVALSGGCFQNVRLLAGTRRRLEARGLRVLVPRWLPPNDGAISYGQAAVAAALLTAPLA
jgi:hydrogenase maturation protein HypF